MKLRKIGALVTAAVMMLTLSSVAFAAGTTPDLATTNTMVTFHDTFTTEDGDKAVNLPDATFHYSIQAGAAVAATEANPAINAGIGAPTITTEAAHAATAQDTTEDTKDVTVDFSSVTYAQPGIYRYVISVAQGENNETKDDITLDSNGAGTKGTNYLDVYVQRINDSLQITNYILMKDVETPTYSGENASRTVVYSNKIDTITHTYKTYTLTITKTVNGSMAKSDYTFTVALNVPGGALAKGADGGYATGTTSSTVDLGKTTPSVTLEGLPSASTYAIKEAVALIEGYQVTVTDDNSNVTNVNALYKAIGTDGYGFEAADAVKLGAVDVNVGFTNTLEAISPTGVILRFAPYVFMLAAGAALLVLSRRRRMSEEDA